MADIGVIGTLLLWHVIGAISSDDGYNLTIARVSGEAGYTANYYRFFGATEAPFDWYQSVLAAGVDQHRRRVDAAARHRGGDRDLADHQPLRAAAARAAARGQPGRGVDGGAVFLAAWLPFNNGLRPEPLIAFGALAAWVLVENAIGTGGCGPRRSRSSWRCSASRSRRRA